MNAKELLDEVRRHKDNCVGAMLRGNIIERQEAEAAAKAFLTINFAKVLDIMDDALTEHLKERR